MSTYFPLSSMHHSSLLYHFQEVLKLPNGNGYIFPRSSAQDVPPEEQPRSDEGTGPSENTIPDASALPDLQGSSTSSGCHVWVIGAVVGVTLVAGFVVLFVCLCSAKRQEVAEVDLSSADDASLESS